MAEQGDVCSDCGRPFLVDGMPQSDDEICFSREGLTRGDWLCVRLHRDKLQAKLAQAMKAIEAADTMVEKGHLGHVILYKRERAKLKEIP